MTRAEVLEGLQAEGARLAAVMLDLGEDDFRRSTPCVPWTVAELLAHVLVATDRLPTMLAGRAGAGRDRSGGLLPARRALRS